MFQFPIHAYYENGRKLLVPEEVLWHSIYRINKIIANNAYPILTLSHLAHITGSDVVLLKRQINRTVDLYRHFIIPKSHNRYRRISTPNPVLYNVQDFILHNILEKQPINNQSHAYEKNKSIATCTSPHIGASWLIKIDIKDFFDSIDEQKVYEIFQNIGYSNLTSFELTRLVTRSKISSIPKHPSNPRGKKVNGSKMPYSNLSSQGSLPQGAPTSGYLSNLAFKSIDQEISAYCSEQQLVYTRYSDDMLFSGHKLNFKESKKLINRIRKILEKNNFLINHKKIKIIPPGRPKIALGVNILEDRITTAPDFTQNIKYHLWACQKHGVSNHLESSKFYSPSNFINYIEGCLYFGLSIDKEKYMKLFDQWNTIRDQNLSLFNVYE